MALTTAPAIDYALPRQQDEGDHWIDDWRPEDPVFWETIGRPIARRNLIFSIFAEHVGFSVWMLWSIVVVQMTAAAPGHPAASGWALSASQALCLVAVPSGVGAFLRLPYLRNLTEAKADVKPVWQSLRHADTWIMSLLYIGTFGSFIGYSAAFPTLLKTVFGRGDIALGWAFLGAGIGSLVRPLGGKLADRIGGARITAASFVMLAAGAAAALWSVQSVNLPVFFVSFMFLFVATGIGNGSSYRMISRIFQVKGEVAGGDPETMVNMRRQAAGALGIISSIGAFGGFVVPLAYAWSKVHFGNIEPALHFYVAFFLALLVVTWYCYLRRTTPMGQVGV